MNKLYEPAEKNIDNPFNGDTLNMENSVRNLVDELILKESNTKSVIGLNSSYGTGKSNFIDMSIHYINQQQQDSTKNVLPVYVNVSESEFTKSPLITILSAVTKSMGLEKNETARKITLALAKTALKITTYGIVDVDAFGEDVEKAADKEAGGLAEKVSNMFIDTSDPKKQLSLDLKTITQNKKVVIFLDDIDRCSPAFAIKILEELKFYFSSIDNMIFVIAYDREQLESFIQSRFGRNIDCDGYLRKFFDYSFLLPSVDKSKFLLSVAENCKQHFEMSTQTYNILVDIVKNMNSNYQPLLKHQSLRSLQQNIARLALGLNKHDDILWTSDLEEIISLLLFFRAIHWKLYSELYRKKLDGVDVYSILIRDERFKDFFSFHTFTNLVVCDNHGDNTLDIDKCVKKFTDKFPEEEAMLSLLMGIKKKYRKEEIPNPNDVLGICFNILEYD